MQDVFCTSGSSPTADALDFSACCENLIDDPHHYPLNEKIFIDPADLRAFIQRQK
jgi:hypothetical protein